jgi:hypothetical protein
MSLKYLKFTYVDAVTGVSVATEPSMNDHRFPDVAGIEFVWARTSNYPTPVPEFFGTCPVDSVTEVEGVLGVFDQQDWDQMRRDEETTVKKSQDTLSLTGKRSVPLTSKGEAGDKQGTMAFDSTNMYYCTANYDGVADIWVKQAWSTTGAW